MARQTIYQGKTKQGDILWCVILAVCPYDDSNANGRLLTSSNYNYDNVDKEGEVSIRKSCTGDVVPSPPYNTDSLPQLNILKKRFFPQVTSQLNLNFSRGLEIISFVLSELVRD